MRAERLQKSLLRAVELNPGGRVRLDLENGESAVISPDDLRWLVRVGGPAVLQAVDRPPRGEH